MQELGERVASVETRLDSCDRRLDSHGRELEELRIRNAEQDIQLKKLCVMQEKSYELALKAEKKLDKMDAQGNTVSWMIKTIVFGIPALFTLYLTFKQMGWF